MEKAGKKGKKKVARTTEYYRKRAVTLAKRLARERDKFKCWKCGMGEPNRQTHGSHIFSEGIHKSMSADLDNIKTLCARHHVNIPGRGAAPEFNWHGSPAESIIWFKKGWPKLWRTLEIRSQKTVKMTEHDWIRKWEELKKYEK